MRASKLSSSFSSTCSISCDKACALADGFFAALSNPWMSTATAASFCFAGAAGYTATFLDLVVPFKLGGGTSGMSSFLAIVALWLTCFCTATVGAVALVV